MKHARSNINTLTLSRPLMMSAVALTSAVDHASRHPSGGGGAPSAMQVSGNPMAAMIKQMMGPSLGAKMGAAPTGCCGPMGAKPFHPSMMDWPKLFNEARGAVRDEALNRLGSGAELLTAEQARLHHALMSNDVGTAQDAIKGARKGLALANSGASALKPDIMVGSDAPSTVLGNRSADICAASWLVHQLTHDSPSRTVCMHQTCLLTNPGYESQPTPNVSRGGPSS